jgi:hypothetical protein
MYVYFEYPCRNHQFSALVPAKELSSEVGKIFARNICEFCLSVSLSYLKGSLFNAVKSYDMGLTALLLLRSRAMEFKFNALGPA